MEEIVLYNAYFALYIPFGISFVHVGYCDMKYLNKWIYNCKADYRHIIYSIFVAFSALCVLIFPNSIPRLIESIRDILTSILYYLFEVIDTRVNPIMPTVLKAQEWHFATEIWKPISFLPHSWEEFAQAWQKYIDVIFDGDNFIRYLDFIGDLINITSQLLLCIMPLIPVIVVLLNKYKSIVCHDRWHKSPELLKFEWILFNKIYPLLAWLKELIAFGFHFQYLRILLFIWLLHFNVYSVCISFLAYYLYFISSWDIFSIYAQLLKLQTDLTPMIRFIPGIMWLTLGAWIFNRICRSMAFQRLYEAERANRAVLSARGVSTVVFGEMGIGKTQLITSIGLTAEIALYDLAFKIMLKYDHRFPNFPWQIFRDELKKRIAGREIVDLPSCRQWVRKVGKYQEYITDNYSPDQWQQRRSELQCIRNDYTFGYDYEHYPLTYNDELKISRLAEALEEYACAYLAFTVKTTLLFANYSIRVDSIIEDIGNMPFRDNDFFTRSPELQDSYSRHAHIVDMDMIRLGKKLIADNPQARRLSYGVYVITEIDKERKNMLELKETKIKDDETNQKNDLFNACLMMSRHAAIIDNQPFIRFIFDLQRPEAWGAGGRELGEVIYISEKDELAPTLPFYSPYWFFQGVFEWIKEKWESFYSRYIENRSDGTLFIYLCKNIISAINNHYDKVNGLFNMQTLTLEIQSGRLDGSVKVDKWRIMTKKDRSNRYRTDCLQGVFESYKPNEMHVDDFIMYANELATQEELQKQNSYFKNDIKKMKGKE